MNKIYNNFDSNSTINYSIDFGKYIFLIVDKDFFSRNLMHSELHQIGVKSFLDAASVQDAIEIIKNNHVDFIITELKFQNSSGFELVNYVKSLHKENSKKHKIPIIIATNSTKQEDVIKARELDVLEYLAKPFSINDLKKKIIGAFIRYGFIFTEKENEESDTNN
jgi:response regulator RpfG family c-di-GMP phosphodiesterase